MNISSDRFGLPFSLISSKTSRASGNVSLLAITETVIAVALYWYVAFKYDTHLHLLVSVFCAPLVLLRSESSLQKSKYLWGEVDEKFSIINAASLLICCIFFYLFFSLVTDTRLNLTAEFLSFVLISALIFSQPKQLGVSEIESIDNIMSMVVISLALSVPVSFLVFVSSDFNSSLLALLLFGIGSILPMVLMPIKGGLVRATSTLLHPIHGIQSVPKNYHRLILVTDLMEPPQIVPNITDYRPKLAFDAVAIAAIKYGTVGAAYVYLLLFAWCVPVIVYRLSIKSTAWFYFPLIYVSHMPQGVRVDRGLKDWLYDFPVTRIEVLRFFLAATTMLVALVSALDYYSAISYWSCLAETGDPFSPFSVIFVVDWSKVQSWQLISILSAIITIILFFWADKLRRALRRDDLYQPVRWQVVLAFRLTRFRTILVITWLAVAFIYFMDFTIQTCRIPAVLHAMAAAFSESICYDPPP